MKITEAYAQIQKMKVQDNYLLITLKYNVKLVLPHKDGLAFLASLVNAEQYDDSYGKQTTGYISKLDKDLISITTLSRRDYERNKVAALLGISVIDLEQAEEEELQKHRDIVTETKRQEMAAGMTNAYTA